MSDFQKIAVPATRSSAAVLGVRRRIVLILLLFTVVSGLLGLGIAVKASRDASNIEIPTEPTRAIAVAEEAGRDFLGGRTSTVPAAQDVVTDWSIDAAGNPVDQPYPVSSFAYSGRSSYTVGDRNPTLIHLIRFRVAIADRSYYLDVPVADTDAGPVLAEAPVLLPAATGERDAAPIDYGDLYTDSEEPPTKVRDAVEAWISAFASAGPDDEELRNITQDQTESHTYSGLDGWTGELETIVSAVPVGGGEESTLREGWIVQARVVLTPPGANGPSLRTTYDVYVATDKDLANLPVLAWGPAGSAEDLTELTNVN